MYLSEHTLQPRLNSPRFLQFSLLDLFLQLEHLLHKGTSADGSLFLHVYSLQIHQVDGAFEVVQQGGLGLVNVARVLMHFLFGRLRGTFVRMELFLQVACPAFYFGRTHPVALGSTLLKIVHPEHFEVVHHLVARFALRFLYLFGTVVAVKFGCLGEPGQTAVV